MPHGRGAPGRLQLYVEASSSGSEAPVTTPFVLNPGPLACGLNVGSPVTPSTPSPFRFTGRCTRSRSTSAANSSGTRSRSFERTWPDSRRSRVGASADASTGPGSNLQQGPGGSCAVRSGRVVQRRSEEGQGCLRASLVTWRRARWPGSRAVSTSHTSWLPCLPPAGADRAGRRAARLPGDRHGRGGVPPGSCHRID